jgi:ribonuclease HI
VFTHKRVLGKLNLYIDGSPIEWKKEVKFLGVIVDERLTWASHISYIVERCKKRLNLMRCLSGIVWGASKLCLLMIYKALIRSVLDYGCIAYENASDAVKDKLDKIQMQALRVSCGAMKGTSNNSLQVECGEQPLSLRRLNLLNKYSIKIRAIKHHAAATILNTTGHKTKRVKVSFGAKVDGRTDQISDNTAGPTLSPVPPWHFKQATYTLDTLGGANKDAQSEVIKHILREQLSKLDDNTVVIFTDGSKDETGRVGAAVYSSDYNIRSNYRLSDNASVYTAEMTAIREALLFIKEHHITTTAILSDSLSVLQSLEAEKSNTRPNLLLNIQQLITDIYNAGGKINFMWIPGHADITGNEIADKLAKQALRKLNIDIKTELELKEAYAEVDEINT